MASAGARAYNGGLEAEPPAGFRGSGQGIRGQSPPEAENVLIFLRPQKLHFRGSKCFLLQFQYKKHLEIAIKHL